MDIKIALAGNPNCGKTTMFNDLTGSSQYVGNWPGVTVEKKEGRLKGHKDVIIQDLPGIYSLSPYSLEEVVARGYLVKEKPDAIIDIVDGTNIERNLYLTTQLIELGIPTVIAVNMIDLVRKNGDRIDLEKLGDALGCEVVEMSALKGEGSFEAAEKAAAAAGEKRKTHLPSVFNGSVEHAIAHIEESIEDWVDARYLRWYAIKLFERDRKVREELSLPDGMIEHIETHIKECEDELEDDAESIIISQRYEYITKIIQTAVIRKQSGNKLNTSDKIDGIVTNRWLALPIFAAVMFLVYYVSISTVGNSVSGWVNNTLFGDLICGNLRTWLTNIGVASWLIGLTVDGMISGVGAVLGFVPQMFVLFLFLSLLEDVGYMSRVAFIMDRIFRRFGLSGKSFIPLIVGSGCSVPGIMASRTIENESDRRITIMTTSFIPCGGKLPIIALFAGALFGNSGLVATSAYFIGIAAVIISGIILKKTKPFSGKTAPFVMELPAYHAPAMSNVWHATWERGWSFVKRAGTVILASSVILWFLQGFGVVDGALRFIEDNNTSLLAIIGKAIAPIFAPLGFGMWQASVATITGLLAKENIVSTFGILYGFAGVVENGSEIWTKLAADFTPLSAYSFLIFNLLCAPCFAAIGAMRREMNSARWTLGAVAYLCTFAYLVSLIVYQIGSLIGGGSFGVGTVFGILALLFILYMLLRKNRYGEMTTDVSVHSGESCDDNRRGRRSRNHHGRRG